MKKIPINDKDWVEVGLTEDGEYIAVVQYQQSPVYYYKNGKKCNDPIGFANHIPVCAAKQIIKEMKKVLRKRNAKCRTIS